MHLEIQQDKPGSCPKCGMRLVLQEELQGAQSQHSMPVEETYTPLVVIVTLILLVALAISFRDFQIGAFSLAKTISYFMAGFFIVFAGFKLMDLKGFAEGYSTYDLLAKRWFGYGYIYPFIELAFGLGMILITQSTWARWLLLAEFLVMAFSGFGVAIKLVKKEKFQCACLGTFLKVPLTKVTLVEDFGMAGLAALLILLGSL